MIVWRARSAKDLEFMYVFHADGTMTESSNYDAFPPGPPAYGVWRNSGRRQYDEGSSSVRELTVAFDSA